MLYGESMNIAKARVCLMNFQLLTVAGHSARVYKVGVSKANKLLRDMDYAELLCFSRFPFCACDAANKWGCGQKH